MTLERPDARRLRHDAILADVLAAQRERRVVRARRRRGAAALALVLVAALATIAWRDRAPAPDGLHVRDDAPPALGPDALPAPAAPTARRPVEAAPPRPIVVVVADAPSRIEIVRTVPLRFTQRIDDDELLHALAAMGRPAGLARAHGETRLTTDVTDPM